MKVDLGECNSLNGCDLISLIASLLTHSCSCMVVLQTEISSLTNNLSLIQDTLRCKPKNSQESLSKLVFLQAGYKNQCTQITLTCTHPHPFSVCHKDSSAATQACRGDKTHLSRVSKGSAYFHPNFEELITVWTTVMKKLCTVYVHSLSSVRNAKRFALYRDWWICKPFKIWTVLDLVLWLKQSPSTLQHSSVRFSYY